MTPGGTHSTTQGRDRLSRNLLTASVCSLGVLLLMILGIARWESQRIQDDFRDRIRDDALYRVETVRYCLVTEAASQHSPSLEQVIRAASWLEPLLKRQVSYDPIYEYIDIVSSSGETLIHCDGAEIRNREALRAEAATRPVATTQPAARVRVDSAAEDVIHQSVPFLVEERQLGTLRMGLSESRINARIAKLCRPVRHAFLVLELICSTGLVAGGLTMWRLTVRERRRQRAVAREQFLAELGRVAGRMVHEIRNPLNAMRMQVAVIRRKLEKGDQSSIAVGTEQLERLEQEVARVDRLATAFLAFGRPPLDEPELIDLPGLIREVTEFVRPEFEQAKHRVAVEIDHDAASAYVRMDRSKLRRVLLNLVENAREAMNEGLLTIRLRRQSRRWVLILVRDTGSGISDEQLPSVFDAFFTTKDRGSGLGLAIVKRIVEDAGGCINVKSQVSQGTCVEIVLPLARKPADVS